MDRKLRTRPRHMDHQEAASWKPAMQGDRYIDERQREEQEQERPQTYIEPHSQRPAKRRRVSSELAGRTVGVTIANGIPTPMTTSEAEVVSEDALAMHSDTTQSSDGEQQDQLLYRNRKDYYVVSSKKAAARIESRALSVLPVSPAFPKSAYLRLPRRDLSAVSENTALADLKATNLSPIGLDDFAIYRPESSARPLELVTLNKLRADGSPEFCFDGVLSFGDSDKHHRVQGVMFNVLSIDGYGELESADMTGHIYLQSRLSQKQDIWYQLKSPASEYARYHKEFVWLASFTRHFASYLTNHDKVTLKHFRYRFASWLDRNYEWDNVFYTWLQESGLRDFRDTVAMNIRYLRDECYNIDNEETGLLKHPIWGEVDPLRLSAIPEQPSRIGAQRTVVTPYAMRCFENMYFADQLDMHEITDHATAAKIDNRKLALKLTPRSIGKTRCVNLVEPPVPSDASDACLNIQSGDVVSVQAEEGSLWGTGPWYAYVQGIRRTAKDDTTVSAKDDTIVLDIIWLYTPKNTTIANVYYPFQNELFFSDHCECGKDAIDLNNIISKIHVSWFPTNAHTEHGFFIRQKFRTIDGSDSYDFVDLKTTDFVCQCSNATSEFGHCLSEYDVGDTVLVRERDLKSVDDHLEPAQIVHFDYNRQQIQVRRLVRTSILDPYARPNELSLTTDLLYKDPTKIVRKCHVRYIQQGSIPVPYDRDGTGDLFYINADSCAQDNLPPLTQGWNPNQKSVKPKLAGMGIFSGGGTFDRGLEEGGAVEFRFAVDWATHALHSHRANVSYPERIKYFLGSVNDLLTRAMKGDYGDCIARPSECQLISAGSPCPGFSQMQKDKYSEQSRMNASMVASVVSFVDFYSPEYLILENVITMTAAMGLKKDQHVFSQIIAALVGLGYQVSQHLIESWSYGSPQRRPRLFIIATAPGLKPLKSPPHSHGHPDDVIRNRSLGTAANGKKFACRRDDYTPFKCNTAAKSIEDLPDIMDAQVALCARFPDHVTACTRGTRSSETRTRIAMIPKRPHGMTMYQAAKIGVLRGEPLQFFKKSSAFRRLKRSKTYSRVFPKGLFPTILTTFSIGCAMEGRFLHWQQDRELTVREARRAQGYPDHEVLVGDTRQRLKIIGNSVDRRSALVLGLELRESWFGESAILATGSSSNVIDLDQDDSESDDITPENTGNATAMMDESAVVLAPGSDATNLGLTRQERTAVDNRSVKMALNLSPEDIGAIYSRGLKHIKKLLGDHSIR